MLTPSTTQDEAVCTCEKWQTVKGYRAFLRRKKVRMGRITPMNTPEKTVVATVDACFDTGPESGANLEVKVEDDTVNDASDEEVPREVETGECSNKLESEGAAGSSGGGGEPAGQESDPYFYTKLDNFTSEIYKIELQNLPNPKKISYKVQLFRSPSS